MQCERREVLPSPESCIPVGLSAPPTRALFNVFNRHGFTGPNTQIGTAGFGEVLPQDLNGLPVARVGQFGARFSF